MVEIRDKKILIDGKAVLLLSGEVHYFRLDRSQWQDRLDKLKAAGFNCVATYIPWLCHERAKGEFDFTGIVRSQHDLAGFLDLCCRNGLYVVARPGPFIMAEMKNEGIPYRVYEEHPELIPVTWDGKPVTSRTLDYLAPAFLEEVRQWYRGVMAVLAPRLHGRGGSIVGVQLDNEIGMLSWISGSPDLTDTVLEDFGKWLHGRYAEALASRYPFNAANREEFQRAVRSPREEYALALLKDLGLYMRSRFARYAETLRDYARECGITGVPFIINIHGTASGRGLTFPIGLSQLYESYSGRPDMFSGTDIYLGDLTIVNFADLYLINAMTEAVNSREQPLTSMEFECGNGDFGNGLTGRLDPSASDLKARMCVAQGCRLINYYLFCGGINHMLDNPPDDGNGRISFTGEEHGCAAPVGPTGRLNYTYRSMAETNLTLKACAAWLAEMNEEWDNLAWGFIPDYYMTEYRYPGSAVMKEMLDNVEANRSAGAWESAARALLLSGCRFGAVDLQKQAIPQGVQVLLQPSALYMDGAVQEKLRDFVLGGGSLLLCGELPQYDMEGRPCAILAEGLSVRPAGFYALPGELQYPTLVPVGDFARYKSVSVWARRIQTVDPKGVEPMLRVYGGGVCGYIRRAGRGLIAGITTPFPCNPAFFLELYGRLGGRRALHTDCGDGGIFLTSQRDAEGNRFLHLLNLDGFEKEFTVYENGEPLFGGHKVTLGSRRAAMLPLNLRLGEGIVIRYSTAEMTGFDGKCLTLRPMGGCTHIAFAQPVAVSADLDCAVESCCGGDILIRAGGQKGQIRLMLDAMA